MVVSQNEARDALQAVAATEERARHFRIYRCSSPHLILWGAIWVVGYSVEGFASALWINITWLALIALGILAGSRLPSRTSGPGVLGRTVAWVASVAFYVSVIIVMHPTQLIQFEVFPALCLALLYACFGVFRGPAYLWISGLLFIGALGGYLLIPPSIYPFFMALCGGGGLICSGIWLGRS